jgi:hypothetical protein
MIWGRGDVGGLRRGAGGGHLLRNRGSVIGALRAQAARLSTAGMDEARCSRKGGNLHWLHAHSSRSICHFERWWQLPMLRMWAGGRGGGQRRSQLDKMATGLTGSQLLSLLALFNLAVHLFGSICCRGLFFLANQVFWALILEQKFGCIQKTSGVVSTE